MRSEDEFDREPSSSRHCPPTLTKEVDCDEEVAFPPSIPTVIGMSPSPDPPPSWPPPT